MPALLKMPVHQLSHTARSGPMVRSMAAVYSPFPIGNGEAWNMLSLKTMICAGTKSITFHMLLVPSADLLFQSNHV